MKEQASELPPECRGPKMTEATHRKAVACLNRLKARKARREIYTEELTARIEAAKTEAVEQVRALAMSSDEKKICRQMGISEDDFRAERNR